jgi:CheY-like chemotaxis protein/anti-sigma regulatory factor (Ser/Thr protein kinase)
VTSDRDRVRQILFNLAGNAVKFTAEGGVSIEVERGAGEEICFTVRDTGPGIPEDRLGAIFEEFDRGGVEPTRASGTGLGLAITRRIVERMAGRIEVESSEGVGSSFRVRLPLAAGGGPGTVPIATPSVEGLRVLLVGNSPFEPLLLERRLTEAGAEPARATDLGSASALLGALRFDVMVADAALGEAPVRELAKLARQNGVAWTIILLSPFERRDFGSPHAAGYDAFLVKPVRSRSLFERLRPGAAPARPLPAPSQTRVAASAKGTPLRVLLAEDNEVNALLAMKSLQKLGALVDWAKDGIEALEAAEASLGGARPAYHVILMDMRMPGLDGSEVTRRIREREMSSGREERIRIVALTASMVGGRERYRETAGFDGFLMKPFSFEALAAELRPEDSREAAA